MIKCKEEKNKCWKTKMESMEIHVASMSNGVEQQNHPWKTVRRRWSAIEITTEPWVLSIMEFFGEDEE